MDSLFVCRKSFFRKKDFLQTNRESIIQELLFISPKSTKNQSEQYTKEDYQGIETYTQTKHPKQLCE